MKPERLWHTADFTYPFILTPSFVYYINDFYLLCQCFLILFLKVSLDNPIRQPAVIVLGYLRALAESCQTSLISLVWLLCRRACRHNKKQTESLAWIRLFHFAFTAFWCRRTRYCFISFSSLEISTFITVYAVDRFYFFDYIISINFCNTIANIRQSMIYLTSCVPPAEGRCCRMHELISFILSVLANVISDYISKWLDEKD